MVAPATPVQGAVSAQERQLVERLVAQYRGRPGSLLTVLEELQGANRHNYLPMPLLRLAAVEMGVPLSRVLSVVTFYAFFNLKPQGDHTVCVCRGTACHTRGSRVLLDTLMATLQLSDGDGGAASAMTTADKSLTVRTVACFGQCALAPVVEVDRTIHGHMNRQKLLAALSALREQRGEAAGGRLTH